MVKQKYPKIRGSGMTSLQLSNAKDGAFLSGAMIIYFIQGNLQGN